MPLFLVAAFCVYVLAWFWQLGYRRPFLGEIRFELVLGTILAVIAVFSLLARPPRLAGAGAPLVGSAFLLLILISIQVPFSPGGEMARFIYIERVVKFSFWALFIAAFVRSARDLRWFLAAFLIATGYVCFEAVRGGLFGGLMWQNQGVMRLHGSTPMFQHPNSLAGLAVGILPFSIYLARAAKKKWLQVVLIAVAAIALMCVMYTGSRTGYLGVIALGAFVVMRARWRLGRVLVLAAALVAVMAALVPGQYQDRFSSIFTGVEVEGRSTEARIQIIKDSVAIFIAHPFGVGVQGFSTVRRETFGRSQDTHNLYLQVATHIGIQGLIVFLILVFLMWTQLSRIAVWKTALGQIGESRDAKLVVATARAVQGYLFVRLVLGFFGHDLYEVYWWLILGLTISLLALSIQMGHIVARQGVRIRRDSARATA